VKLKQPVCIDAIDIGQYRLGLSTFSPGRPFPSAPVTETAELRRECRYRVSVFVIALHPSSATSYPFGIPLPNSSLSVFVGTYIMQCAGKDIGLRHRVISLQVYTPEINPGKMSQTWK
jgi:hypothetical protein